MVDEKTSFLEALMLHIAAVAQKEHKPYYFGGGIAVDLSFGGLSRPHEDLDFYPLEVDTAWWQNWFRTQGYIVSKDTDMEPLANAFSVSRDIAGSKDDTYLVDVYPIAKGRNGEVSTAVTEGVDKVWDGMLTIEDTRGIWPGKSWNGVREVTYKGQVIAVEDYKTVLMQKTAYVRLHPGETLSEKHLFDFARAGIKPEV
jgi:hypothetical protein